MIFFKKKFSGPSNPPDELAQNVSKKNPFRTNYSSIFLKKFRIWPFFIYLHDSNSIFRARRFNSEFIFGLHSNELREWPGIRGIGLLTALDQFHGLTADLENLIRVI